MGALNSSRLGLLISFFEDEKDALYAFRTLQKRGFRRMALLTKNAAGRIHTKNAAALVRGLGAALGAFVLGLVSIIFTPHPISGFNPPILNKPAMMIPLGLVSGALIGWLFSRLLGRRIDPAIIESHSDWLLQEENALFIQAPVNDLGRAIEFLREEGKSQPAVFPIHPDHGYVFQSVSKDEATVSRAQLCKRAATLAKRQCGHVEYGAEPGFKATLDEISKVLAEVQSDFSQAERLEQNISVSAEWVLDNTYIIEAHIEEVSANLSRDFYKGLPMLDIGEPESAPRVIAIARELVALTDNRVDRDIMHDFLKAYQEECSLKTVELWAFPLALRLALIERLHLLIEHVSVQMREHEQADFWANRFLMATRYEPNQLINMLAEFTQEFPDPDTYLASQIIGHLYDEDTSLGTVQDWLEGRLEKNVKQIMSTEQSRQAAVQISIGNAVTTLRELSLIDWRRMFEGLSLVEAMLNKDPSGVYPSMDFDTRDHYRQFVETVARRAQVEELDVAGRAVDLARQQRGSLREGHVGYFLIDDGRDELLDAFHTHLELKSRAISWIRNHHTVVYLFTLSVITFLIIGVFLTTALLDWSGPSVLLILAVSFGLLPASQLALYLVNDLVTRVIPPWVLPKLSFEDMGIPGEFRTLVIVPVLLARESVVREEIEKLEVRYLANPERNILYGLFSDYLDADHPQETTDESLLSIAEEGIRSLNVKYGSNRFFLFHRERSWSETQGKYIGWERKRGKLMELNSYLVGERTGKSNGILQVGAEGLLADVRFVITLDSDTQLPKDTARHLIETLAHPLNQPLINEHGKIEYGYTVIQPRISTSLPSATATPFSRLFNDPIGVDPYTSVVSDVYQDLTGEGSFIGKGIYDFRAFHDLISGRFPEENLLSHDLLEGAHVRVGLASDIELFDDFPANYLTYVQRQHRWIRGDWQIAAWATPKVPDHDGNLVANPLNMFNRWKILDNLRRSLVPIGTIGMLTMSWMHSVGLGAAASVLTGLMFFINSFVQPFTWPSSILNQRLPSLRELVHRFVRSVVEVALLPHRVAIDLDAIVRVWFRKLISKRYLLEWTTTKTVSLQAAKRQRRFVRHLIRFTAFSFILTAIIATVKPGSLKVAALFLILWAAIPVIGIWLDNEGHEGVTRPQLTAPDRSFLRSLARKTWRFFDDFVVKETHWLPPDNYQMSLNEKLANRTSPTNIGLWMASVLAASDFGFLTMEQMADRISKTLTTLDNLELFKGHLLNWYNIETLEPLTPRYVSTVDSGNLLASLWTVRQGVLTLSEQPIVDRRAISAIKDVVGILAGVIEAEELGEDFRADLEDIGHLCTSSDDPFDISCQLEAMSPYLDAIIEKLDKEEVHSSEFEYWVVQLKETISTWQNVISTYLGWLPQFWLSADRDTDISLAEQKPTPPFGQVISLSALTQLDRDRLTQSWSSKEMKDRSLTRVVNGALQAFDLANQRARRLLGKLERISESIEALEKQIDMRFLYDEKRRLFSIGYDVENKNLDSSFYDLLASEARLSSYIAIARDDVPVEHWLALSRPYRSVGHNRALLSWTGTMFEYLMPAIFQGAYPNSLLDQGMRAAVALQEQYGRAHAVPWGISESAFGDLDYKQNYMYKAFGVPALGLKRGLEERLVVAPYASTLALMEDPAAALANLHKLSEMGMANPFGLYEAIDFSRPAEKSRDKGVIVHSVMAHHQGMSLLALDNVLNEGQIRERFHSDVRVKSTEPLLYERVPVTPALYHLEARDQPPVLSVAGSSLPVESSYDTPNTTVPQVQILSNGNYSLMITNAGGGYSKWGDMDLTRWRADTTRDHWGSFCYLRDVDADRVWSATYHPTDQMSEGYQVRFPLDKAEFQRTDDGLKTSMQVIIAPEDDVELRRVKLRNISNRSRTIELTSYYELAMTPRNADRQHPAFQKLFIETEAVPEQGALIASRRKQDPDQASIFTGHTMVLDDHSEGPMQYETDRKKFIGRGHDIREPAALRSPLSNSTGYVLDPILSLRREVDLMPGQEIQCTLVLAAADSRKKILDLLEEYNTPEVIARAFELAWARAQLELRMIRIEPEQVPQFRQTASHVLFPNAQIRPPGGRLLENTKSQQALWAYGISGDLPIAAVTIGQERDIILVRQMLQAHAYWRKHGLVVDLLIINEQEGGYQQALHDRLIQMARAHSEYTGMDQPGGVFIRSTDRIAPQDLTLMLDASRVSFLAARGSLAQQLSSIEDLVELPEKLESTPRPAEPSTALSHIKMRRSNGLGGFSEDGHEYIIEMDRDARPEAPWINVMANPGFGMLVSEQGSGFTWHGNSQRNRLTAWSNDPVIDPASEAVYIRDEQTGQFWTPTAQPIHTDEPYRVRHGAGYTVFEHNSHAIEQRMTMFVPVAEDGDPIRVQRLELRNSSSKERHLSVTFYLEWTLGENRDQSQMHIHTEWDARLNVFIARNPYRTDYGGTVAFMSLDHVVESYTGDRAIFLGRNGDLSAPAAMERTALTQRVGPGYDPCAALRVTLKLQPGQTETINCLLGEADSNERVQALLSKYREDGAVEHALEATRQWWDDLLGGIQVDLPDEAASLLLNRWLLYQDLSCRLWGRSAFYQSGGAYGFRDQLQDVMALIYSAPEEARKQILRAAGRQFEQGDVQHWWHPPSGAGVRTRISDDPLWLIYVVAQYVRITADVGILKEKIPFLDGEPLGDKERERYFLPDKSDVEADLYEHCRRALERAATSGKHGLPLIGSGDWNDGLNRVGSDGKGESVWLGWFLVEALHRFAELSNLYGEADHAQEYRRRAVKLRQVIDRVAWDGRWYLRAFTDEGEPVGGSDGPRSRIFSLPQSWATLAGLAEQAHAIDALKAAWEELVDEDDRLALLFSPPFELEDRDPGYVRGYPPGVRENGGQYTHGALWLALAFAMQGEGARAVQLLNVLNPIEHSSDIQAARRYEVEPYAVAADIYALPGDVGRGGWTWYTGSAGWMYRVWLEGVLGLRLRGAKLGFDPVIPPEWEGFSLSFRYGKSIYDIRVVNPDGTGTGVKWVELDGKRLSSNQIELEKGSIKHEVIVHL